MKKMPFVFMLLIFAFSVFSCELFNQLPVDDLEARMEEQVRWARAPWVPLRIETGAMGTSSPELGSHDRVVKKGFSFQLNFQPFTAYPFLGWQAWIEGEGIIASWRPDLETGTERVHFIPRNAEGTEATVYVFEMPPSETRLHIGPLGSDIDRVTIMLEHGGLGMIQPTSAAVRAEYPFAISFQPHASYPFRGWQARVNNVPVSQWSTGGSEATVNDITWSPQNASGTEIRVTMQSIPEGNLTIMPIGGDIDAVTVAVIVPGSWGSGFPAIATERRKGFPFDISFSSLGVYEFRGWRARFSCGAVATWRNGVTEGDGIQWQYRNASGTDMSITIDTNVAAYGLTLLPIDSEHEVASLRIETLQGESWGGFSPLGLQERRKSFPLNIEFTPNTSFAFIEWRAYLDSDWPDNPGSYLSANYVEFADNSALRTTVTVHPAMDTDEVIVLVPFSIERPRLNGQLTNPPLSPITMPFPFDQRVNIHFTTAVQRETIRLGGENPTIRIRGIYTSGANRGELFGGHGDISVYFRIEEGLGDTTSVELIPKNDDELPGGHYARDLELLSITVSVGPYIKSADGVTMAAVEVITYQTDTTAMLQVYRARNIQAQFRLLGGTETHTWLGDSEFTRPDIDRRFRQQTNQNTVSIRFEVEVPPEAPVVPNRITVTEYRVFNLQGAAAASRVSETHHNVTLADGLFTIEHTLVTTQSGIIRLVVTPWFYDGTQRVEPQAVNEAVAEGRFVMVVLDNEAPGGADLNLSLSTPSSGGNGSTYVYGEANLPMTITFSGLFGIADNGGGIPAHQAFGRPWTMDAREDLRWEAMIGQSASDPARETGQLSLSENTYTWSPENFSGLTPLTSYGIFVRFEDSLGNCSGWLSTDRSVQFSNVALRSVLDLRAVVNPAGNNITVSWTVPSGILEIEMVVRRHRASPSGCIFENETTFTLTPSTTSHDFAVPQIITNRVRDGEAVSNVFGYEITVRTRNVAGTATTGPIWVYNIPDMHVTQTNTRRVSTRIGISIAATADGVDNIVLTQDITIDMRATESIDNRNFFGNGHTVTITGINSAVDMGLFGSVGNGVVRDLTVVYNNVTLPNRTAATHFGGIAGRTTGTTQIINSIVRGTVTATTSATTTAAGIHAGGMVGTMDSRSRVDNGHTALNLTGSSTNSGGIRAGGIAGQITNNTANNAAAAAMIMINNVTVAGTITAENTANTNNLGLIFLGGIVGESFGLGIIQNVEVSASLNMSARSTNTTTTVNNLEYVFGGIIGRMVDGHLNNCIFSGEMNLPHFNVHRSARIGGIAGLIGRFNWTGPAHNSQNNLRQITVRNSTASGDLNITALGSGSIQLGGVVGAPMGSSNTLNIVFYNTEYRDGNITFVREGATVNTTSTNIGGFVGDMVRNVVVGNSRALAGLISITSSQNGIDGFSIGGFAGLARGDIIGCYTSSPIVFNFSGATIDATTLRNPSVGGFIGTFQTESPSSEAPLPARGYALISESFATGSVTVIHSGAHAQIRAGGFVGEMSGATAIRDSYALGNVLVNVTNAIAPPAADRGSLFVGGIAGAVNTTGTAAQPNISHTFSTGSVTVMSAKTTNAVLHAGGIAGSLGTDTRIRNSAALGPSVTAQGGSARNIGRISGTAATVHFNNNFASSSMQLFLDSSYNTLTPTPHTLPTTETAHNQRSGQSVAVSHLQTERFWTNNALAQGPGFSSARWSFTGIIDRRHPLLLNVRGQ